MTSMKHKSVRVDGRRRRLSAPLDHREETALTQLQARFAEARDKLAHLDPDDRPVITADMGEQQRAETVERIADHELRAELKRLFGTLELPASRADIARLALRLLERTVKGAVARAGLAATEADPVRSVDNAKWAAEGAADLDAQFSDNEPQPMDFMFSQVGSPFIDDNLLSIVNNRGEQVGKILVDPNRVRELLAVDTATAPDLHESEK